MFNMNIYYRDSRFLKKQKNKQKAKTQQDPFNFKVLACGCSSNYKGRI